MRDDYHTCIVFCFGGRVPFIFEVLNFFAIFAFLCFSRKLIPQKCCDATPLYLSICVIHESLILVKCKNLVPQNNLIYGILVTLLSERERERERVWENCCRKCVATEKLLKYWKRFLSHDTACVAGPSHYVLHPTSFHSFRQL